jgi:hypothetical protein
MTRESIANAAADMTAHRLIDLRNQVTFDTQKAEQMLARHGRRVPDDLREGIATEIASLRKLAAGTNDAEQLSRRLTEFGRMTVPLAEAALSATLADAQTRG